MANLQIKGMDDALYEEIKKLAAEENRSVSQETLFLIKNYLSGRRQRLDVMTPAQILLDLAGSWEDSRDPETLIADLKKTRKNSAKLAGGL